jgi:hypothetical protein
MPTLNPVPYRFAVVLLLAMTAQAQDLHIKKNITVGGNLVASTETSIKGARERTVSQTPTGNSVTIRQCDLKQTLTINEQSQTYLITKDPQDDAALKAAAMLSGAPDATSGGYITETAAVTDTGERKTMYGYPARHLRTKVTVQSSQNACSQQNQSYEVDGWYADIAKDMAACQQFLPPVRQSEGCSDRVIRKHTGSAKPGYPLVENITLHNADGSTQQIGSHTSEISKPNLEQALFDAPVGYRQVKTQAELAGAPPVQAAPQQQAMANPQQQAPAYGSTVNSAAAQQQAAKMPKPNPLTMGLNPAAAKSANAQAMAAAQQQMAMGNSAMSQMGMANGLKPGMQSGMPGGVQGAMQPAPAATPAPVGPKQPGKIRIGVAPADAQLGQGSNTGNDYSTPIRNAEITLMSGPAVDIVPLDARISMQLQAEAQQKQCDFVMFSSVLLKRSQGAFGKWSKFGSMAASVTPVGMMAHGAASVAAAQAANVAASQMAQQQAISQLAAFNGQVKSKDDVTVKYQLVPTGQDTPTLEGTLQGKAKSDGEDVLTPMLTQTAVAVLTQVSLSNQAAQNK